MTTEEFKSLTLNGETTHLECKLAKNAIPANFWGPDKGGIWEVI